MKILVTGASGFVGRAFAAAADAAGHEVVGLAHEAIAPTEGVPAGMRWITGFDLRDAAAVLTAVARAQPDAVLHLAAVSSVGESWRDAWVTVDINLRGTANLLRAVIETGAPIDVLLVGSAEAYGAAGTEAEPLVESMPLYPRNPYGGTKAAQEALALGLRELLAGRLIVTRSFPHIGPGQADHFVIPNWTKQLIELERDGGGILRVGDTSVVRDIADVRDVAGAYLALLETPDATGAFNVCTGRGRALADILDRLQELVGVKVDVQVDESRLRPNDIRSLVGSPAKLRDATGWQPRRELDETLRDIVETARTS